MNTLCVTRHFLSTNNDLRNWTVLHSCQCMCVCE